VSRLIEKSKLLRLMGDTVWAYQELEAADAIKTAYVAGIDYANQRMYVESNARARAIESGQEEP
jgi:hypothetical protein